MRSLPGLLSLLASVDTGFTAIWPGFLFLQTWLSSSLNSLVTLVISWLSPGCVRWESTRFLSAGESHLWLLSSSTGVLGPRLDGVPLEVALVVRGVTGNGNLDCFAGVLGPGFSLLAPEAPWLVGLGGWLAGEPGPPPRRPARHAHMLAPTLSQNGSLSQMATDLHS